jgi:hypothetical protein
MSGRKLSIGIMGLAAVAMCAGCSGMTRTEPTEEPTEARVVLVPAGTETATQTPTSTFTPSATPLPTSTQMPSPVFLAPEAAYSTAEPQCAVPTAADLVTFTLPADAPAEARESWDASADHAFSGEVTESDPAGRSYRLQAVDPALGAEILVQCAGQPLPIEAGHRYQFTLWEDPPGATPSGRALRVSDDTGLLVLIVNVRETDGASMRILGGDRAGYAVRQLPSLCREGPVNSCGYELRAAPLEVARGDAFLTLDAGQSGAMAFDPPYVVTVATSHYRLPIEAVSCKDPTDWVQSYRIQRQAATATPTP